MLATFISLSALLIFLTVDYLAVLFVLIYGGAISILIMFVIMMLDLKELEIKTPPIAGFLRLAMLVITLGFVVFLCTTEDVSKHIPDSAYRVNWFELAQAKSNIEVVGLVFYNHYNFQFMFMGFILFLTMLIIISLVIRKQENAKRQVLYEQLKETNNEMLMFK